MPVTGQLTKLVKCPIGASQRKASAPPSLRGEGDLRVAVLTHPQRQRNYFLC